MDPRVGSPTGSNVPNAAPNGIENPKLNWFGEALHAASPRLTLNPNTKAAIEIVAMVMPLAGQTVKDLLAAEELGAEVAEKVAVGEVAERENGNRALR